MTSSRLASWLQSEYGRVSIAFIGFLADGYALFIIGLVEILLEEEYVKSGRIARATFQVAMGTMAAAALAGAVLGQLVFGPLADRIGRRVAFVATGFLIILGAVLSSIAVPNLFGRGDVDVFTQIAIARLIMGFGIGGEYPLSASIAAESSSKRRSGTLMAVVFSGQGWGYLLACLVVIAGVRAGLPAESTWRFALGFTALLPAVTMPFRMMMHESQDFRKVQAQRQERSQNVNTRVTMRRYLWHGVGTAVNWFLWDIVWYSNGLFSQDITTVLQCVGSGTMGVLMEKTIVVLCMLPGFALSIIFLHSFGTKNIQVLGYAASAVLFAICALAYAPLLERAPTLFFVLYSMTFLFSNFGPNTTTYIIPGEIFPSQIKATFHGLSAASGKVGAVIGTVLFPLLQPDQSHGRIMSLGICAVIRALGAVATILWTPRYTAEDLEPKLAGETVGFVPLRWQRGERRKELEVDGKATEEEESVGEETPGFQHRAESRAAAAGA